MKQLRLSMFIILSILFCCSSNVCSASNNSSSEDTQPTKSFFVGWALADITPLEPVLISGQFHARVSEGVLDPITSTVLALESKKEDRSEKILLISCDLCYISDKLREPNKSTNLTEMIRQKIVKLLPEFSSQEIVLNATHTHAGPLCTSDKNSKEAYGVELDAMSPYKYMEYASDQIAQAAKKAWGKRDLGGVSYGLGYAVLGRNRLMAMKSGKSQMYGNTNSDQFSHIEGHEDHSVNLLYTWDKNKKLTGVVINVAVPSQVTEAIFEISADFWHETRVELKERFGEDVYLLAQASSAGDQSPHLLLDKKADERMQRLQFPDVQCGAGTIGQRKQIAKYLVDAVSAVYPYMEGEINFSPVFKHRVENVPLSRRLIGQADVDEAKIEYDKRKKEYETLLSEINQNKEMMAKSRWYMTITEVYARMRRAASVKERYELEKVQPKMPIEVHVLRIGDIVMATNPFELYLDYGEQIKARNPFIQTFLVQLAGGGTYLPTERSIKGGAYGAVPASTLFGPEGGKELVEKTLEMIHEIY